MEISKTKLKLSRGAPFKKTFATEVTNLMEKYRWSFIKEE
jgi:hypothetical protein